MLLGVVVELVQVVERNELVFGGTVKITRINVIANVGVPKEQLSSTGAEAMAWPAHSSTAGCGTPLWS